MRPWEGDARDRRAAGEEGAPPRRLVVATFNIAHGRGRKPNAFLIRSPEEVAHRLAAIASQLRAQQPDLVLLQEVDREATWSHRVDMAETLARALRLGWVAYQPNYAVDLPGLRVCAGNAIVSRWPILDLEAIPYDTAPRLLRRFPGTKRGMGARVELPGGEHLLVQCHHFAPVRRRHRALQSARVVELVEAFERGDERAAGVILGGDFNMGPGEMARSALAPLHLEALPRGEEVFAPSFPSYRPTWAFDHVFVRSGAWRIVERRVIGTAHSDHCPVVVRLARVG